MRWIHQQLRFCRLFAVGIVVILVGCFGDRTTVIERTEYREPTASHPDDLIDDLFDAATVPKFDPERIDSREVSGWTVNLSAAVTKLDLTLLRPDTDRDLLKLHPNYRDAIRDVQTKGVKILPSVNLIDGKAKQFDDGLLAALEQHWFQAHAGGSPGDLDFLQRLAASVPVDSRAAAFLAVGLELADITIAATNLTAKTQFKNEFDSDLLKTKPIGFYAWNKRLSQCYRVGRFLQTDFKLDDTDWMQPIVETLRNDSDLQASYRRILARWARLSNAPSRLTAQDLVDHPNRQELLQICRERNLIDSNVSLIPPGSNRESELTRRLFPRGFSANADIMRELVKAIRNGVVDLQPTEKSGWYDYQVYALETLLVPKRGVESNRLLLSASYKRRMLEAFQALMTKRKETHVLRTGTTSVKSAMRPPPPLNQFSPRLRLEPAPTYYLRMARSYRFLNQALRDLVAEPPLAELHGWTEHGPRSQPLLTELRDMQRLFYGCYLLSAEDIGLGLDLTEDEQPELDESRNLAEKWLDDFANDPDLSIDTRVIVPVAQDLRRRVVSSWATIGIRFSRLKASYIAEAAPRVKTGDTDEWKPLEPEQLEEATYLIAVDEFVSVQVPNSRVLSREEFQRLCDGAANHEEIVKRLQD